MSRYFLLFLLNLPFILAAILSQITQYKLGRSTKRRLYVQLTFWILILVGMAVSEPFYKWLLTHGLTTSDSLSLFDVVQITAIVVMFYVVNRTRLKLEVVERRLQDLHQELSIKLSTSKKD